jgi:short-subunit dehydrogenase
MAVRLKPLREQVIVVTGASSGIGLATVRRAVAEGARVVMAARSIGTLDRIAAELRAGGGDVLPVKCDVTERDDLERLSAAALEHYGRFDTWVNDAGVSIYGRLEDVRENDSRRLFETNFWGVVNGSLIALRHLRVHGGALINVGSEVSQAVIPLQGMYSASKHAVKGFTDALRVEVEQVDGAPVAITLIQPTATDTPFPQNARNYMAREPKLPTPLDDPDDVAKAILAAAASRTRERKVGAMSRFNVITAKWMPGVADRLAAKQFERQHYDEPPRDPEGALWRPSESGRVRGTGPSVDSRYQ